MQDDGRLDVPLPLPRKAPPSKIDRKSTISAPFNFRHVSHVGMDFKSEDVRRAIRPMSKLEEIDGLPVAPTPSSPDDGYEKVSPRSSQQSSQLDPSSTNSSVAHYENVYGLNAPSPTCSDNDCERSSPLSSPQQNMDLDFQEQSPANHGQLLGLDDLIPKVDKSQYQNIAPTKATNEISSHMYQNIEEKNISEMNARLSKKTKPAPPPPPEQSSRNCLADQAENHKHNVMWRPQAPTNPVKPQPEYLIKTPEMIEHPSVASLGLERPDMLGEMKLRLDDRIPVPPSVSSRTKPAEATTVDRPQPKPRTHWISELPVEEQKRISSLWQEATGETEVPDDSNAVKKRIALFESRLRKPPPRPPAPRRHAPPPPIDFGVEINRNKKGSNEASDGGKGGTEKDIENLSLTQENKEADAEKDGCSQSTARVKEIDGRLPSPYPTSLQQFPIPKPRMRRLDKVNEETVEITCSETPVLTLPEYFMEECLLNLSLIGPNTIGEASCEELRHDTTVMRSEATFTVCEKDNNLQVTTVLIETPPPEDNEENLLITRF